VIKKSLACVAGRLGLSGAGYWVESECDPNKEYWVVPCDFGVWVCNCKDFQQRGGPCKHALAVQLFQMCEQREQADNVIAFPTPTLDPDAPIPYVLTDKALALTNPVA
jgi:hypothetical protein